MPVCCEPKTDVVDGNPKAAFGALKAPLHLVPPALELYASVGLAEGAPKYGPYNWREPGKGIKMSTYFGAIKRHLYAMMDGEDVDPDSPLGKLHLQGLAANVAILCDAHAGGFLTDDRPLPGPAPRLVLQKKDK